MRKILGIVLLFFFSFLTVSSNFYFESKIRDNTRMNDIKALQGGIEQFYQDNGEYPSSLKDFLNKGVTEYLLILPKDPLGNIEIEGCKFGYYYEVGNHNNGIKNQIYRLSTCLENETNLTNKYKLTSGGYEKGEITGGFFIFDYKKITNSQINLTKQLILSKIKLENTKWNKYVSKFEILIPTLSKEKLISIDEKLKKIDLSNSKYKNFKDILGYLKAKIGLELYGSNVNNEPYFKIEDYNECSKLKNLKTIYLYKNGEKIEIANEINGEIKDVRQEGNKIYYTWDSQIDPGEKVYDIKSDIFIDGINCKNCARKENICK